VKKKVFISRQPSECTELIEALNANEFEVHAESMISTEAIHFDPHIPLTDWIFFSSSNAVRHFFDGAPHLSEQRMAAIGKGTAQTLAAYHSVDFIGDAMDIEDSAYRFADLIQKQTVLFPVAGDSLRHVQAAFDPQQIIDLPVYRTIERPCSVGACDIYVFSSPSNVRSFFNQQEANASQMHCVAFGEATAHELRQKEVHSIQIPQGLDAPDLLHTIIRLAHG
jgi:uroporphyrinogen-III synthase